MKPDEKWRQLVAESHAARRVLDYALAPILKKATAIGAGTARENSSPEEDARLQTVRMPYVNVEQYEGALVRRQGIRNRRRAAGRAASRDEPIMADALGGNNARRACTMRRK